MSSRNRPLTRQLTFGSLFSGIGGLDLGLERAGMKCLWQSEIDSYASRVLAKHWPNIPNLGDINEIEWQQVAPVDVICGGYPCQPFSVAGARKGTNDPRHLWPRFADAIRILRPRFALLENVTGHLSLGFGDVQADLASIGYDTQWDCIPAAAVGAPHLRDRVFIVARDTRAKQRRTMADSDHRGSHDPLRARWNAPWDGYQDVAYTSSQRSQRCWDERPTTNNSCTGRRLWEPEPGVGRVADGIPNRMDRLRGLGNAVVPQVAEHVGRIILELANA